MGPYASIFEKARLYLRGRIPLNTLEPSKGGTGSKLNTAKAKLYDNNRINIWFAILPYGNKPNFKIKSVKKAKIAFDNGPAKDTITIPCLGELKYLGLIGTGFAHPNFAIHKTNKPNGSRCAIGFNVNLPFNLGVGSPKISAALACEYSWIVIDINSAGIL